MNLNDYDLHKGDKGQEVFRLQKRLALRGIRVDGKEIQADGKFGPITHGGVEHFQRQVPGLTVTGVATPATLSALGIPVLPGLDLSAYQRDTDIDVVLQQGAEFIIRKATEGTTHINKERGNDPGDDRAYERDIAATLAAGKPGGFYHFGRADTHPGPKDAIREAKHFVNIVGAIRQNIQPTLDVERMLKRGWNYNAQWIIDWCEYVEERLAEALFQAFGVRVKIEVIIYTAKWAISLFFRRAKDSLIEEIVKRKLWLADYDGWPDDEMKPWDEWTIWQHTGSGRCPGVHGKCDLNYLAGGKLSEIMICGL